MNRMVGDSLQHELEVGSIIAEKYRIDRMLAEGGMGVVVAATHIHLDQIVALKFLRADVSPEFDALARFTREARAAARLRSEYVARVLDAGVTGDGTPYIAMEYLEGQNLAQALQIQGPLDVSRAVEYMIQVCEGLAEAHGCGIVHRDIKPYNLFLVERSPGWSAVKILDFGISKTAFADAGNIATGVIIGSPCYISPEQLRSTATVDHRTDIWSVGATLYELLAGRAAFDASQTLPELITAILHGTIPGIHEVRPEVPVELSAVVARCMEKDREARFESAGELAMALLPFAPARARIPAEMAASVKPGFRGGEAISTDRPSAGGPGRSPSSVPTLSIVPSNDVAGAPEEPPGPARRRPWVWVATASAATAVLLVLVLMARTRAGNAQGNLQTLAPVAPPQPVTTREAPPPEAGHVEIVVRASPPFAQITIDDRPVENPFVAAYPKDGTTHRIEARAWGYEAKSEAMPFTADTVVDLSLYRRGSPASPPVAVSPQPKRGAAPIETEVAASRPAAVSSAHDVDPSGGRTPLRPIETSDPYGAP